MYPVGSERMVLRRRYDAEMEEALEEAYQGYLKRKGKREELEAAREAAQQAKHAKRARLSQGGDLEDGEGSDGEDQGEEGDGGGARRPKKQKRPMFDTVPAEDDRKEVCAAPPWPQRLDVAFQEFQGSDASLMNWNRVWKVTTRQWAGRSVGECHSHPQQSQLLWLGTFCASPRDSVGRFAGGWRRWPAGGIRRGPGG